MENDILSATQKLFIGNLKRIVKAKGLNQGQAADSLEMKRSAFNTYCTGKRFPSAANLDAIAEGLGVRVSEFFKTDEEIAEAASINEPLVVCDTSNPSEIKGALEKMPPKCKINPFHILVMSKPIEPYAKAMDILECVHIDNIKDRSMVLVLAKNELSLMRAYENYLYYTLVNEDGSAPMRSDDPGVEMLAVVLATKHVF
jgi:transcriptional regulator with XRE-family HTH domain